jgi:hypothetical protein
MTDITKAPKRSTSVVDDAAGMIILFAVIGAMLTWS